MQTQLDLFYSEPDNQDLPWSGVWDEWIGPQVGGYAEINTPVVDCENGERVYAYMDTVELIELRSDGKWLAVIGIKWHDKFKTEKDGTRVILNIDDLWPPLYMINSWLIDFNQTLSSPHYSA